MTPTFSLGCGTWGGSTTTDNVNYRNLLNIKTVSRRQTPPQWFRVPSDTYFNAGALDNLREIEARSVLIVTDARARRAASSTRCARTWAAPASTCSPTSSPSPTRSRSAPASRCSTRFAPGRDRRGRRRLGDRRGEGDAALPREPRADAARAVAARSSTPASGWRTTRRSTTSVRLVAIPTTAGTGSEVSPAAVLTVGDRKVTLVDYSLVPDMAIVEPRLTVTMPPALTADTGHRRAHPRARGGASRSSPRRSRTPSACRRST